MIVVDANLLIYAINQDAPLHREAKTWLESAVSGVEPIGLPWPVLMAFLRLTTRPGLFKTPLPLQTALELVDAWLREPMVSIIEPTINHWPIFRELIGGAGTAGNLTSDAHLAALAIGHDAILYSADNDFARFAPLRWRNPLI